MLIKSQRSTRLSVARRCSSPNTDSPTSKKSVHFSTSCSMSSSITSAGPRRRTSTRTKTTKLCSFITSQILTFPIISLSPALSSMETNMARPLCGILSLYKITSCLRLMALSVHPQSLRGETTKWLAFRLALYSTGKSPISSCNRSTAMWSTSMPLNFCSKERSSNPLKSSKSTSKLRPPSLNQTTSTTRSRSWSKSSEPTKSTDFPRCWTGGRRTSASWKKSWSYGWAWRTSTKYTRR